MWKTLVNNLSAFSSAVITGLNSKGYPASVRCIPIIDQARQVLVVQFPSGIDIQPGHAGLLCHSHDERLWNLKSFIARGVLEPEGNAWIFHPTQFIPGAGTGGFIYNTTQMFKWRKSARQYIQKRGLTWPAVSWEDFKALRAEARKNQLFTR